MFTTRLALDGTPPGTVWVWLIAIVPTLQVVSLLLFDWQEFVRTFIPPYRDFLTLLRFDREELARSFEENGLLGAVPPEVVPGYVDSGILIVLGIAVLLWVFTVVFAALDHRELKARQIQRPFPWTFVFLGVPLYVLGRSLVIDRRTGSGLGPLWVYLGGTALSIFVGFQLAHEMYLYMWNVAPHVL